MIADEENLRNLVFAYDLQTVGVTMELPKEFEKMEFTPTLVKDHMPPLESRSSSVAYSAMFCEYLTTNPNGTNEQFRATMDGNKFYAICQELDAKLDAFPTHEELMRFKALRFLNLTRVNFKKQVQ